MRNLAAALLLIPLLSLNACWKKPLPAPVTILPMQEPSLHTVPVITGSIYELPKITFDTDRLPEISGKEHGDIVAVITTPASTTETVTYIYKKKRTLRQTVLPKHKEQDIPIQAVSDNPQVQLAVPEHGTPWYVWLMGALAGVLALWQVVSRIWGVVHGPIAILRRILKI